ncbi:MAG: sigma-70 family RNA polymerase sigma factor [bacterium]|nr:sigma-70 family RNA polymerase sigma factor [bacterium]
MGEQRSVSDAERVSGGDADALQRLIVHCHETLHRAVARVRSAALVNRIDPDDVLQQAYVVAFKTLCAVPACEGAEDGDSSATSPAKEERPASAPPRFANTGHFYKWLEAVALNRLRDAERELRSQKRDVAREVPQGASPSASYPNLVHQLVADGATPSREMARGEAVAAVMSSLARLPGNQRDVIRWRFIEGIPFDEIARRLSKSEDATYMICHRGLKTLRGLLVSITRHLTRR